MACANRAPRPGTIPVELSRWAIALRFSKLTRYSSKLGNRWAVGARRRAPTAHLLPNFDEYLVSFENRSAIAHRLSSTGIVPGRGALLAHAIVVDGQVVGGWKRTLTKKAVVVDLRLLVDLTRSEREAVREAAQAFGAFLEQPVELRGL